MHKPWWTRFWRQDKESDMAPVIHVTQRRTTEIISCDRCDGVGYRMNDRLDGDRERQADFFESKFVDHHLQTVAVYTTDGGVLHSNKCERCHGEGRVVRVSYQLELDSSQDYEGIYPIEHAVGANIIQEGVFKHVESNSSSWRHDIYDRDLERKYPSLNEKSYSSYKKELEDLKVVEKLSNEESR